MHMTAIESVEPDFETSLRLDARAPRVARHHVAQVDRPAPDLRDAVVLLTSELVSRAVAQCKSGSEEVQLRVWMPHDVVRVELRASRELLRLPLEDRDGPDYDVMLLAQVADRWSIDTDQNSACMACMWFEIDRQARKADPKPVPVNVDRLSRQSPFVGLERRTTIPRRTPNEHSRHKDLDQAAASSHSDTPGGLHRLQRQGPPAPRAATRRTADAYPAERTPGSDRPR
jgi:hypothetical protein